MKIYTQPFPQFPSNGSYYFQLKFPFLVWQIEQRIGEDTFNCMLFLTKSL